MSVFAGTGMVEEVTSYKRGVRGHWKQHDSLVRAHPEIFGGDKNGL